MLQAPQQISQNTLYKISLKSLKSHACIQGSDLTGIPLVISAEITSLVNHKQFKSLKINSLLEQGASVQYVIFFFFFFFSCVLNGDPQIASVMFPQGHRGHSSLEAPLKYLMKHNRLTCQASLPMHLSWCNTVIKSDYFFFFFCIKLHHCISLVCHLLCE